MSHFARNFQAVHKKMIKKYRTIWFLIIMWLFSANCYCQDEQLDSNNQKGNVDSWPRYQLDSLLSVSLPNIWLEEVDSSNSEYLISSWTSQTAKSIIFAQRVVFLDLKKSSYPYDRNSLNSSYQSFAEGVIKVRGDSIIHQGTNKMDSLYTYEFSIYDSSQAMYLEQLIVLANRRTYAFGVWSQDSYSNRYDQLIKSIQFTPGMAVRQFEGKSPHFRRVELLEDFFGFLILIFIVVGARRLTKRKKVGSK